MAVLAECPNCHQKQSIKNKLCKNCELKFDQAKRAKQVKYWVDYRLKDGSHIRECLTKYSDVDPYSLEDAKDVLSKRRVQKREKKLFDVRVEVEMTFKELTDWYLDLKKVQSLASYPTLKFLLNRFNSELGSKVVSSIKLEDLENYQAKRKGEGKADKTVDDEIGIAKVVINKAFDNGKVDGDTLRTFKKVKKLLKKNSNARKKIISIDQFNQLMIHLPLHTKWILATGFYTGMRLGEIVSLTWDKVSLKDRSIQLGAKDTKDREPRSIPICDDLYNILKVIPKAIHDDHVFLFKGKPIKNIKRSLSHACKEAKIPYGRTVKDGFVFHDLRHSFNTHMRKAGVPESVIMEITGHSSREMFDRYNTVDEEDRREAIRKLEGFFRKSSVNVDQNVDQTQILR